MFDSAANEKVSSTLVVCDYHFHFYAPYVSVVFPVGISLCVSHLYESVLSIFLSFLGLCGGLDWLPVTRVCSCLPTSDLRGNLRLPLYSKLYLTESG